MQGNMDSRHDSDYAGLGPNHDVPPHSAIGVPGRKTATQSLSTGGAAAAVRRRIQHAKCLVEIIRTELLPRGASAAAAIRRDLAEIDRELAELRDLNPNAEQRAEIDQVACERESLRFETKPALHPRSGTEPRTAARSGAAPGVGRVRDVR